MYKGFKLSRVTLTVTVFALLVSLAPTAFAQDSTTATQSQTQATQTAPPAQADAVGKSQMQVASTPAGEAVAAKAAVEPLYKEYKGVTLGMSAKDVRAKLGKPEEKSDVMDFYVFNGRERARVYYTDGKASAVIATYIGKDAAAPAPTAVLGSEVEARPDGSMYLMKPYPQAGYWVAYSRTSGDSPMVMITMQKTP
jgi:hypothetical protein